MLVWVALKSAVIAAGGAKRLVIFCKLCSGILCLASRSAVLLMNTQDNVFKSRRIGVEAPVKPR